MENLIEIVKQVAGKYPATLTHEQCALIVNEVAWLASKRDPHWGISKKTGGKRARLPNSVEIGEDVLHYRAPSEGNPHGRIVDILEAAPNENKPTWSPTDYHNDPSGRPWLPAFDPALFAPSPAAPTPSAPSGPSLADLAAKLDAIGQRLDLLSHNSTNTAEGVQRLEAALKTGVPLTLRAKLIGDVKGTVGGPSR
jgi:hypothetical protein